MSSWGMSFGKKKQKEENAKPLEWMWNKNIEKRKRAENEVKKYNRGNKTRWQLLIESTNLIIEIVSLSILHLYLPCCLGVTTTGGQVCSAVLEGRRQTTGCVKDLEEGREKKGEKLCTSSRRNCEVRRQEAHAPQPDQLRRREKGPSCLTLFLHLLGM